MSNYTVSQPARLSVLLEEREIASYLSYTAFAVAMISVLQALHFARDAVVTKCGAEKKPTPDLHHEGHQNGEQGKTGCLCGCCKKLGRKLTWLYHKSESFFTNVCVLVLPYILLKPLTSIGQSDGVVYLKWPAMYSYVTLFSAIGVPVGIVCLGILYLYETSSHKFSFACCAAFVLYFFSFFVLPLMFLVVCASFYIFVADGFVFFINFSLVFSFSLSFKFSLAVDMLQIFMMLMLMVDMTNTCVKTIKKVKTHNLPNLSNLWNLATLRARPKKNMTRKHE